MLATHENERYVSSCPAHIAFDAEESLQSRAEQNERGMARSEVSSEVDNHVMAVGKFDARDLSVASSVPLLNILGLDEFLLRYLHLGLLKMVSCLTPIFLQDGCNVQ